MAVTLNTFAWANDGNGNSTLAIAITIATGHTNLALVVMSGGGNQTNGKIGSVTGAGATWGTPVNGVGNGTYEGGFCLGTAPSTGAQTVTLHWAGTTDQSGGAAPAAIDLQNFWIDASVNGEGVMVSYLV